MVQQMTMEHTQYRPARQETTTQVGSGGWGVHQLPIGMFVHGSDPTTPTHPIPTASSETVEKNRGRGALQGHPTLPSASRACDPAPYCDSPGFCN